MFELNEKYEVNRRILKYDFLRYSFAEKSLLNTPNIQTYDSIPREESVNSLLYRYHDLNFKVIKKLIKADIQMVMINNWFIWDLLLYSVILS